LLHEVFNRQTERQTPGKTTSLAEVINLLSQFFVTSNTLNLNTTNFLLAGEIFDCCNSAAVHFLSQNAPEKIALGIKEEFKRGREPQPLQR